MDKEEKDERTNERMPPRRILARERTCTLSRRRTASPILSWRLREGHIATKEMACG